MQKIKKKRENLVKHIYILGDEKFELDWIWSVFNKSYDKYNDDGTIR